MNFEHQTIFIQGRRMHPVMQVLVGLLGIAGMVALFFLGVMFFAVFAGIALVAGLVIWVRLKWLAHKHRRARRSGQQAGPVERMSPNESTGDALEGEFIVIEKRDRD